MYVAVQVLVSGLSSIAATKSVEMIGYKTVALSLMLVVAGLFMAYLTVLRTEGPHMMSLGTTDRHLRTGNLGHRHDHEDHFTRLLKLYQLKMEALQKVTQKTKEPNSICTNSLPSDEECVDLNCVHTEPESLPARLHSVIDTMNSSNVETLNRIMQLKELQVQPTGKRLLFITAASSNHYLEFQAMLKNFHETVAPNFSNYSLIFYDLGLTLQERAEVKKYCNCEVKTFPVLKMEYWMQKLTCYTWKPLIVQANIKAADILVWMDASVRLTMQGLMETLQDVQIQGMVIRKGHGSLAQHTDTRMMSYFNTTSCVYAPYKMSSGGFIFLHNEQFVGGLEY
ncbi:uncharacterized protein LOC124151536 [Haliotis rufescens]|uniref:uncharacterized protein LOC124151536 n=1 Tax=Haliotis rufescens TaxID=6454 RepID=UPI00201F5B41|nr:uncharacterized protein LOC124151536 [Haliotis rufescens]